MIERMCMPCAAETRRVSFHPSFLCVTKEQRNALVNLKLCDASAVLLERFECDACFLLSFLNLHISHSPLKQIHHI